MDGIIAYLYIETLLLSIFTIWFLCRVKKRWIRWEKIVPDMREFVKRNEKRINMILKGIVASFLILSFVDVVIPAVQDFPIVMSENYLEVEPFIFDRFYCADKSRTNKAHFGLGLSIAKELAKMLSGKIGFSDTSGGGTTFFLTLPIK